MSSEANSNSEALDIPGERVRKFAGDQMLTELATIMPVIAAVMIQEIRSDSCTFYVYDAELTKTIATLRHGEAQLIFPDKLETDSASPWDIPVEAEVLRTQRSVRRMTDEDFNRLPLLNESLQSRSDGYMDLVVPLAHHGQVYGVAYMWRTRTYPPFSDLEVMTAENLASVGAMAVEFARHFSSERTRRLRLNALLNVASLAASHHSVDQVLPEIAAIARSVTEANVCNLYSFEKDGKTVVDSYSSGLNEEESWVFAQSDAYDVASVPAEVEAAATLEPVIVRDPATQLAPGSELIAYAASRSISEILVVPIVYQRSMIGVMYLWNRERHIGFTPEVMVTIQAIANQAGGVIEQARLYDDSQRHIRDTEALRRIGDSVLNGDSVDDVFNELASVLNELIPYDYCFVGRVDEDADAVVVAYKWGDFPPEVLGYQIPLQDSLAGRVAQTGEMINAVDPDLSQRSHSYASTHFPIYALLTAPLTTEDGQIGVLCIGRRGEPRFDNRDERLMALFAHQAAAAIERTQARESMIMHANRQAFLANLTNALISAPEPIDILQDLCEMAVGVVAESVVIGLTTWRYGEIQWHGSAHVDQDKHQALPGKFQSGQIKIAPERTEFLLNSETPVLMPVIDGMDADGREIDANVSEMLRSIGARQVLTVPMLQQGRAPGIVILMTSDPERNLDDPDVQEIATIVANRVGDALERRQMALNREALLRFSQAINTHVDLNTLIDVFVSELQELVPHDQLYLGQLDPEADVTVPLAFINPHGLTADAVAMASNEGISGEVMRTRKALLDNDAQSRSSTSYGSDYEAIYYAQHGESAMAAPLIADDTVIGVVFIGRSGSNRFSEADFETFLLFSGLMSSAIHRTQLLQHNQLMYRASVEVLAAVVDVKDPTTLEHSRNVSRYSRILATDSGLPQSMVERIELAGLLHDIGKISIPDHVLQKPGPLTTQERTLINTHSERGERILSQHPALMNLMPLVRHHHERVDGTGYPDGLRGDEIPVGASIIGVAEAFDTITSPRTYQQKRSVAEAIAELERNAGTQFDAGLVKLFVRAIRADPDIVQRPVGAEQQQSG